MENLLIQATGITPKISFDIDQKVFEISGESRPENVKDFFDPILSWLNSYFNNLISNDLHTFKIKLEYFNSSSAKYLLSLLKNISLYYTIVQFYMKNISRDQYICAAQSPKGLSLDECLSILDPKRSDLLSCLGAAYHFREQYFKREVMVHILNNVQNGLCPEDCRYCAQSKS